ncbi:MAG: VWA domain-containing protein [Gammaproteobacteria bacterium]
MMPLQQFHFLRPEWLIVLLPLSVLVWLMVKRRLGSRSWESVCDESLLPYILIGSGTKSRQMPAVATATGGLLAVLALAGPVWEKLPQPVFTRQSALVIALDLSRSMDANDITPSRVARARFKIADILKQRREGETALLVYAGDGFTVTPMTDDIETIRSQLKALTTDIMPLQGNRTDIALKKAAELLKQAGFKHGDILLMTDEVDGESVKKQATALRKRGYRISLIGIGTDHGVPVPLADGSFLKDNRGEIVVPILNEKPMRLLAKAGGGIYQRMTIGDEDINRLQKFFSGSDMDDSIQSSKLKTDVWREQGPWLLLLLLPLAAMMFRRGYLAALLICLLPFPDRVQAFDWAGLWLRPDQQAQHAMDSGDNKRAEQLFKDPAWKGAAQYRAGDFDAAVDSLEKGEDIESLYNKGNALARAGRYQEAIDAYKKVLAQKADHEDAKFNKELLEEELKKQQQRQNQQQSDQNREKQDADKRKQQQSQQNKSKQKQDRNVAQNNDQNQDQNRDRQSADRQQEMNKNREEQKDADKRKTKPEQNYPAKQKDQPQQQQAEAEQQKDRKQRQQGDEQSQQLAKSDMQPEEEQQQATEQWLRRIPDDPAGLLRRKFLYQYQQRRGKTQADGKTW